MTVCAEDVLLVDRTAVLTFPEPLCPEDVLAGGQFDWKPSGARLDLERRRRISFANICNCSVQGAAKKYPLRFSSNIPPNDRQFLNKTLHASSCRDIALIRVFHVKSKNPLNDRASYGITLSK